MSYKFNTQAALNQTRSKSFFSGGAKISTFVIVGVTMMGLGALTTWGLVSMQSQTPLVADTMQQQARTVATPQEPTINTSDQLQDIIARASTSAILNDIPTLKPEARPANLTEVAIVQQPASMCVETLNDLAASGPRSLNGQAHLDLARNIARNALNCEGITISVEVHATDSSNEVENLMVSWRQAEDTIAALAFEGLDVSAFRPLGFGSRGATPTDPTLSQSVTFRILPHS